MASGNMEISEPAKKKLKISSLKTQPINPHLLRTPSGPASLRQLVKVVNLKLIVTKKN